MHNHVILTGRFTDDPELQQTANNIFVCRFILAVQRKYNKNKPETEADFIEVEVWRNTAEFVSRYFAKGDLIDISGSLRTSRWKDKEDKTHYRTYVAADSVEFAPANRRKTEKETENESTKNSNGDELGDFEEVTDNDNLPF